LTARLSTSVSGIPSDCTTWPSDLGPPLASTLPVFIATVVMLSLLLVLILRSSVMPLTARVMNLLLDRRRHRHRAVVFQHGWAAWPLAWPAVIGLAQLRPPPRCKDGNWVRGERRSWLHGSALSVRLYRRRRCHN
jgi:hypothetical protein